MSSFIERSKARRAAMTPEQRKRDTKKALIVYGVLFSFFGFAAYKCGQPDSPAEIAKKEVAKIKDEAQKKIDDDKCRRDIKCISTAVVQAACQEMIPKLAKNSMRWVNPDGSELGFLDQKFEHSLVLTRESETEPAPSKTDTDNRPIRTIRLSGNKAQFQNGFGAWRNVTYYCDVDVIANNIIDVGTN